MSSIWVIIVLVVINTLPGSSLNRPNVSSCAAWSFRGVTFANETWIGHYPVGISITQQNTIYVTNRNNGSVVVWRNYSTTPTLFRSSSSVNSWSLFATNGDVFYIDSGYSFGRVEKWTLNEMTKVVMNVNTSCTGLFVDRYNNLYCSSANTHRVFKLSLKSKKTIPTIVAGTGCPGPVSNMLDHPHGIFVDENADLYVADTDNNRVQRFPLNQLNAITVAGSGNTESLLLNRPTDVVLDADSNLFIVDSHNRRIIRSSKNKSQCIIGCSNKAEDSIGYLNNPQTMAFDTMGNIFVTDSNHHRVQKYNLIRNTCDCPVDGTVIRFDDVPGNKQLFHIYNNISWSNAAPYTPETVTSGYHTAIASRPNVLFNGGAKPMTMKSAIGRLFNIHSATMAAAWYDNLKLTVVGSRSNTVIANNSFILQVFKASYITFSSFTELDTITFTSNGGTKNAVVLDYGQHFGMDDICLSFL